MNQDERIKWLAERKSGIGGSDAAAVLGLSPWRTPVDVWLDKTGRAPDSIETPQMRYGTYFEDYVARLYCEKSGNSVENYRRMLHKGCLLGNLDRLVVPTGAKIASHKGEIRTDTLLECKTSGHDWDGAVPVYYEVQVLHYMGLDDHLRRADVAVLYRSSLKFEVFHVERDDDVISAMQERLSAWWDEYVIGDKMPPPVNESDCRKLWSRSNPGKSIQASGNLIGKIKLYLEAQEKERTAKGEAAAIRSDICAAMGDAEAVVGVDGKAILTWKSAKDSAKTDWEAIARELGATAEQIAAHTTMEAGSRRFSVKTKVA